MINAYLHILDWLFDFLWKVESRVNRVNGLPVISRFVDWLSGERVKVERIESYEAIVSAARKQGYYNGYEWGYRHGRYGILM